MSNLIAIIRDIVLIVTGVIGSAFAIYKYKKSREAEAVLQLELELKVHNFSAKNLVDVSIQIKNVGKAAAYVSSEGVKKSLFMVRKISCPENHAQLVWEQFENQDLINYVEYMGVYGTDYPEEDIIFEPGSIDTYSVFFSTAYQGPIWIRAKVIDKEEYEWIVDRLFILPKP